MFAGSSDSEPRAAPHVSPADLPRTVVLVEGVSDQRAVEALARRRERDLGAEEVAVIPIGGSKNIRRYLAEYGPRGHDIRVAGLCDAGEQRDYRRGLERTGFGSPLGATDMESLGFFVCVQDLEDELIRALGVEVVEQVIESQRELRSLRTLQTQEFHQHRPVEQQLRRFMGSRGTRKIVYATLLVDALDLDRVPTPLGRLLAHI
jgi:predicted ATP-dependent endonuclease of OLD family